MSEKWELNPQEITEVQGSLGLLIPANVLVKIAHAASLKAREETLKEVLDEIQGFELDGESVQLRFSIEQLKSLGQWPVTLMRKSAALKAGRKP